MIRRTPKNLIAAILLAAGPPCIAADDGLYSDIRGTTVFQPRDASEDRPAATGRRVAKADDLVELLKDAGMEPQVLDDTAVTARKSLAPWEFPVLVRITDDERHVAVFLGLASLEDPQKAPSAILLGLLETSLRYPSVQFGYSRERKRTEVFSLIRNESLTGTSLRDEITRLAIVGRDTADVWSQQPATEGQTAAPVPAGDQSKAPTPLPPTSRPPAPLAPTPLPPTPANSSGGSPAAASLTGKWSAARSAAEAFAAEFFSDGRFVLVCVRQGKSVRSSGTFTISGQILSLNDTSGTSLTGTMSAVSDAQFSFTPKTSGNPASPLTFRRAR